MVQLKTCRRNQQLLYSKCHQYLYGSTGRLNSYILAREIGEKKIYIVLKPVRNVAK